MDNIEAWVGGGTMGSVVVYFSIQYLKTINVNLKALVSPIEKLQNSISELNIKIATIIADRNNDKDLIDELRRDVKKIQINCRSCARGGK